MDDLRINMFKLMQEHGLGWVDNGNTDIAHCYCGYRPKLGQSWHLHVVDALIEKLELAPHDDNYNVAWTRYITGWIK